MERAYIVLQHGWPWAYVPWSWPAVATIRNIQVEFKRISLPGFRSCTSRSHYRSFSKKTTRFDPYRISQVTYRRACLMFALEGFPSSM
ncbi:hypothetical protein Tco_1121180 [Tanacetum coccineum]|uniref:Uncharacterized protein n=1 Tax=Tanacetum coccineum TaxID=301880 RepID=A0ABQ5IYE1_9ASTR